MWLLDNLLQLFGYLINNENKIYRFSKGGSNNIGNIGTLLLEKKYPLLSRSIYSFHMPLFFIISGFFVKPEGIKRAFLKYSNAYIKPYLVTCFVMVVMVIITDLIKGYGFCYNVKDIVVRCAFGSGSSDGTELFANINIVGPIWFLLALFWGATIYSFKKNGLVDLTCCP